jgi:hypothetical protein
VYAGLMLIGIHDRCSPGLASMVSAWSALLGSFEEVQRKTEPAIAGLGVF